MVAPINLCNSTERQSLYSTLGVRDQKPSFTNWKNLSHFFFIVTLLLFLIVDIKMRCRFVQSNLRR